MRKGNHKKKTKRIQIGISILQLCRTIVLPFDKVETSFCHVHNAMDGCFVEERQQTALDFLPQFKFSSTRWSNGFQIVLVTIMHRISKNHLFIPIDTGLFDFHVVFAPFFCTAAGPSLCAFTVQNATLSLWDFASTTAASVRPPDSGDALFFISSRSRLHPHACWMAYFFVIRSVTITAFFLSYFALLTK